MSTSAQQTISTGNWVSHNAQETFELGAELGAQLVGGEILLLSGPLGAGKTVFVKGLASALGIDPEEVTSPSFTLVNPYKGSLSLYHIDLYRLDEGVAAAHAVDLDELLMDEQAVIVIEWAERLGGYRLPSSTWRISISGDGDEPRTINVGSFNVRTGSGSDRVE
jgi:tRNA threonylcarbamoyladenosine biosynthesis protein TsaE